MTDQLTRLRPPAPDEQPPPRRAHPLWWVLAALAAAGLVVTRVAGISRSLWWDEAFTAHRYVTGGAEVVFDPERFVANNHVLYSLLSSWTAQLLYPGNAVLRLWVVGPALLGAALVGWWAWRRLSPAVAITTTVLLLISPLAVRLQTEARGYGLVLLAASVLLVVTSRGRLRPPRWGDDLAVAAAGVVGMLTFPPFVFLYLAHTGVWAVRRSAHRIRLVVATAAAGALAFVVLRPLFGPLLDNASSVGSRAADPITWWSPVIGPLRVLGDPSFDAVLPGDGGVAGWVAVAIGIVGLVVLLVPRVGHAAPDDLDVAARREVGLQLVAALGVSIALLGFVGFSLLDRYVAFTLPAALVAVAVGVVGVVRLASGGREPVVAVLTVALLAGTVAVGLPAARVETTLPRQDFAGVIDEVARLEPETIVVRRLHVGFAWYLDRRDLSVTRTDTDAEATEAFCDGDRPAVYLPDPDREPEAGPDCLDEATRLSVPQSGDNALGPGGEMGWYVLE